MYVKYSLNNFYINLIEIELQSWILYYEIE